MNLFYLTGKSLNVTMESTSSQISPTGDLLRIKAGHISFSNHSLSSDHKEKNKELL